MSGTTYIEILSLRICSSTRVATCGSSTSALPRRYAARSTTHYSLLTTHYTLLTIRYSLGARQDLHAVRHARVPTTRGHSQPGPRAACRLLGLGRAPLRDAGVGRTPHPSPLTLALAPTLTLTLTPTPTLTLTLILTRRHHLRLRGRCGARPWLQGGGYVGLRHPRYDARLG